jgi:hypothetical protein
MCNIVLVPVSGAVVAVVASRCNIPVMVALFFEFEDVGELCFGVSAMAVLRQSDVSL